MFPTAHHEDILQVTSHKNDSSLSSDAQDSSENSQATSQHCGRVISVNMLITEFVFCVALALTTYGALHNTPNRISKHPQAVRFFNSSSVVHDWYRGQLTHAFSKINQEDVAFVMYYAPWDAECQFVKSEFEKAAKVLQDRVHFAAINCWNPGSECRLQHNKIPSWPILMAYTKNSRGVLYKGPRDAHSMVQFMELMIQPLERIVSMEDLVYLLSSCDVVALGYTPLAETTKYYNIWYLVALKSREYDTLGEICFGVVISEDLAYELGANTLPHVRLFAWNETKDYYVDENNIEAWNETTLMHWVLDSFVQPVARVVPVWKKSFNFARYVDGNPILLLFTPLNPLYEQVPYYSLLREIAMEYDICKNNKTKLWTKEVLTIQQVQRKLYQQKDHMKICKQHKLKKTKRYSQVEKKQIVSHNNKYPWHNTTQKNQKNGMFSCLMKKGLERTRTIDSMDGSSHSISSLDISEECNNKIFPAEKNLFDTYEKCEKFVENFVADKNFGETGTTMITEDDVLSADNLIHYHIRHYCRVMEFAEERDGPIHLPEGENETVTSLEGLGCSHNFSLYMIAVDSVQNHHFAESLGVDVLNMKDKTAVVILDSKHESQYVLSEEYTEKSLRDFIQNFTNKQLKRTFRSNVKDAAYTHYFGSDSTVEKRWRDVNIIDLTTNTFRRVIWKKNTVTLVAVCGGVCNALISLAVVSAARLLKTCGVQSQAARLDALRHDLPSHYTVSHYPTLLIFSSADGMSEPDSLSYPRGARVSVSGLVAVALRSLGSPQSLRVRLALCNNAQTTIEKRTCLRDFREHVVTMIGRNLSYWRRTDNRELRDALFRRLQHLHRISLQLSLLHITHLQSRSEKHESLLKSLTSLDAVWDIKVPLLNTNPTSSS